MNTCTGSNEPTYPRQSFGILGAPHVERTSLVDPRFHEPLLFNGHVMYGQEAYPQATAYEGQHQAHNVAFSDLVEF